MSDDNEQGPDVRVGQQIERSLVTNSLTMDKSHQNTELCYLVSFTEWNGKQNTGHTRAECIQGGD